MRNHHNHHFLRNKAPAFVLADSMVALLIVVMASSWFLMTESQLVNQHHRSIERLQAARIAKEAADAYQVTGRSAQVKRQGLAARASGQRVVVTNRGQLVLEVR